MAVRSKLIDRPAKTQAGDSGGAAPQGPLSPAQADRLIDAMPTVEYEGETVPAVPFEVDEFPGYLLDMDRDERQEKFKDAPLADVSLKDLVSTQTHVTKKGMQHALAGKSTGEPHVIKQGGKYYLDDGTHRAVAAQMRGEKNVKVRLIDLDEPAPKPAPAPAAKEAQKPAAAKRLSGPEIQAIADETRTGGFGPNKVMISHAFATAQKKHPSLTLDDFKQQLLDANRRGDIHLSRADLVQAMHPEDVKQSETNHPAGGQFHFVLAKPDENREWSRPESKPADLSGPKPASTAHPLAALKNTHGIDLTHLSPGEVEKVRQHFAGEAKPTPKAKAAPKAETPAHVVATADKVKALASKANDANVTREDLHRDLAGLGLEKMPLGDLQALGRHLSRDPASLKTKSGAIDAIRRKVLDVKGHAEMEPSRTAAPAPSAAATGGLSSFKTKADDALRKASEAYWQGHSASASDKATEANDSKYLAELKRIKDELGPELDAHLEKASKQELAGAMGQPGLVRLSLAELRKKVRDQLLHGRIGSMMRAIM